MADVNNIGNKTLLAKDATVVESTPIRSEVIDTGTDVVVVSTTVGPNTIPYFDENTEYVAKELDAFGNIIVNTPAVESRIEEAAQTAATEAANQAVGPATQQAEIYRDQAEQYKDEAKSYSEIANVELTFYKTSNDPDGTIAGIAGTQNNELFRVPDGPNSDVSFKYYSNVNGVAVLQAQTVGVNIVKNSAATFASLLNINNVKLDKKIESDYLNRLRDLNLAIIGYDIPIDYIRQYGSPVSYSKEFKKDTVFKIESLSLPGAVRRSVLRMIDSIGTLIELVVLESESIVGTTLNSPYIEFPFNPTSVTNISISQQTGLTTAHTNVNLPGEIPSDSTRIIYDRAGKYSPFTPATIGMGEGITYNVATNEIIIALKNSDITNAGYTLTNEGVTNYIKNNLNGYILSQKTPNTKSYIFCNLFKLTAGNITIVSDGTADSEKNMLITSTFYTNTSSYSTKTQAQILNDLTLSKLNSKIDTDELNKLRELGRSASGYTSNVANISLVNSPLSAEFNFIGDTRLVIDRISLGTSARVTTLNIIDSIGTAQNLTFLEGEYTDGDKYYSPYLDFYFNPRVFNNIVSDTTTGYTSMDIDVVLPGAIPADSTRIIRDRKAAFGAFTPVTIKSGKGITYNESTNRLILNLPNSEITSAGYTLDQKGIISYVLDNLRGYKFSQMTSTVVNRPFCNIFSIKKGQVNLTTDGLTSTDKNINIVGGIFSKMQDTGKSTTYKRYEATVYNNLEISTVNRPVKIKFNFKPGEVLSDKCLVVKDTVGNTYPCQWAGEPDFNPRRGADTSYWGDGSLRSGNLLILDNLSPNSSKKYIIQAYPTNQIYSVIDRVKKETQTSTLVTADDGTEVRFDSVVGWLPYKVTRDSKTYTSICQHLLITRNAVGDAVTIPSGYADAKYTVISDGLLFTELEIIFKNAVNASYPKLDKQYLEMKYRVKVFKNGYIEIDGTTRLLLDLPENILFGNEMRVQFDSTSAKTIRSGYNSIWVDNGITKSASVRYANGDVRRDDGEVNTLASRPSVSNVATTATYSRLDAGWAQYSATILGAPKDWAWTLGYSFNMNEPISDNTALSNIDHNPPAAFASPISLYPRIRKAKLMNSLGDIISGIVSWAELDASSTDTANGAFNVLAGSLARSLHLNVSNLNTEYAKFDTWATTMYGGIGNIHMGSAAEYKGLQFASRLVLPHLHWLYKLAQKADDTAKMDALKVAIGNMAQDCHNAFGGIGKANSNFYAASYRAWALAKMVGLDTNGTYSADMDMLDGLFSSSAYFEGVTNIITDNPLENVGGMRYLHYQMYAYNNYVIGCKAVNRTPVIDMKTYILNSISGYGGLKEIDYCVAESRRGNPTTVGFMLYPLVHSGDVSCLEAASRLMDAFEEYAGSNTSGQIKLWDLNYLSTITTSFSEYTFAANILADTWMQWWFENNQ